MPKNADVPVVFYGEADRIPDDRPGAGPTPYARFERVREAVLKVCRRHGTVYEDDDEDPVYHVIDDQYNDERYHYLEICKPEGITRPWLTDLIACLQKHPHWGVVMKGAGLSGSGGVMVFGDRVVVLGAIFQGVTTLDDVLNRCRDDWAAGELGEACTDDAALQKLTSQPGIENQLLRLMNLDNITDVGLASVARLANLQALQISGVSRGRITDQGIAVLPALEKLKTFSLRGGRLTDRGIAHLAKVRSLQHLAISGSPITDHGLDHLVMLSDQLEEIDLRATSITDKGLKTLGKFTKLKKLDLQYTAITNAGLRHLHQSASLHEINLIGTAVTEQGCADFRSALPQVIVQWVAVNETCRRAGRALEQTGGWVNLDAPGYGFYPIQEDAADKPLTTRVSLQEGWRGDDADLVHLRQLAPVSDLEIRSGRVTDRCLHELRDLDGLEFLTIGQAKISPKGLAILGQLSNLKMLHLEGMDLGAESLPFLADLPRLEFLGFRGSKLTEDAVKLVSELENLSTLDLRETPLSAPAVKGLQKRLPRCTIAAPWDKESPDGC